MDEGTEYIGPLLNFTKVKPPVQTTTTTTSSVTVSTPEPPPPTLTETFWEEIGPLVNGNPGVIKWGTFKGYPVPSDYYLWGDNYYLVVKLNIWKWDNGWKTLSPKTLTMVPTGSGEEIYAYIKNLGEAGTPYYFRPQIIDTRYGTVTANLAGFGNWNPPLTVVSTTTSTQSIPGGSTTTVASTTTITISPPGSMSVYPSVLPFVLLFTPVPLFIYLAYVRGRGGLGIGKRLHIPVVSPVGYVAHKSAE